MPTLYRKYRPQKFAEISGQNHIKITLQNEISKSKIAHAYLFCGPRGTGKTTMARLFAKAVNCVNRTEGEYEPCNECDSCREVIQGNAIDVIEIDAASNTGVDNVRDNIINSSRFLPTKRKFKIFIIDEVHMLSASAFNALLKVLEEPPAHVIFILATTEIHKIIPTIISRCQRFDFKKIGYKDLSARLKWIIKSENIEVEDQVLDLVASQSDGCLRDAESLLSQLLSLDDKRITIKQAEIVLPVTNYNKVHEFLEYVVHNDAVQAIKFINLLIEDGFNLEQFNKDLIEYLRKILLYKINGQLDDFAVEIDDQLEAKMVKLSEFLTVQYLIKLIDRFIASGQEIKNTVILQLPLEMAVVDIIGAREPEKKTVIVRPESEDNDKSAHVVEDIKEKEKNIKDSTACITPEVTEYPKKNIVLDDLSLKNKWTELKDMIKADHYILSCVLSTAVPKKVENNKIIIALKHKFNLQKLLEPKNLEVLNSAVKKIYQMDMVLDIIQDETLSANFSGSDSVKYEEVISRNNGYGEEKSKTAQNENQKTHSDGRVQNVLDVFGGEVVN